MNQDGKREGGRAELARLGGARRAQEAPLNAAHYIVNHTGALAFAEKLRTQPAQSR